MYCRVCLQPAWSWLISAICYVICLMQFTCFLSKFLRNVCLINSHMSCVYILLWSTSVFSEPSNGLLFLKAIFRLELYNCSYCQSWTVSRLKIMLFVLHFWVFFYISEVRYCYLCCLDLCPSSGILKSTCLCLPKDPSKNAAPAAFRVTRWDCLSFFLMSWFPHRHSPDVTTLQLTNPVNFCSYS